MKKPTTSLVLLLSNADGAGGIAYNLEAICNSIVGDGGRAIWNSVESNGFIPMYLAFKDSEIVVSTSLKTLFYSSLFRLLSFKPVKVIQIIYHPSFADGSISRFRLAVRATLSLLGVKNILYYCDEALFRTNLESHNKNKIIGLVSKDSISDLSDCAPIEFDETCGLTTISTVARFVSFKYGYLCGLIDYAKKNKSISINIVGFGPLEGLLKERARNNDRIKFYGKLSRIESLSVIAGSNIYIGMGTTLLDSTWLGVPALIAEENEGHAICHGFFHDQHGIGYGEKSSAIQSVPLDKCIEKYLRMTPEEKSLLRKAAISKRALLRNAKPQDIILNSSLKADYFSHFRAFVLLLSLAKAYIFKFIYKKDYK